MNIIKKNTCNVCSSVSLDLTLICDNLMCGISSKSMQISFSDEFTMYLLRQTNSFSLTVSSIDPYSSAEKYTWSLPCAEISKIPVPDRTLVGL